MNDRISAQEEDLRALRFACSCASAAPVASDPWVAIAKQGKLADGTKERILNALHLRPLSITELSVLLTLSPPAVHRHVSEMLASELIREEPVPPAQRRSPTERHYRPNFPIVRAPDQHELQPVMAQLAETFADSFRARKDDLLRALARTSVSAEEESSEPLLYFLFTSATRLARKRLEETADLPPWPAHSDGSRWVWWGEEPAASVADDARAGIT